MTRKNHGKVDAATIRQLAVASETDPRTVNKILAGESVRGLAAQRVERALRDAGLLPVGLVSRNKYGYTEEDLRSMQEVRMAFKALSPPLQAVVLPQLCAEHSYYASGGLIDGDRRKG